MTPDEKKAFFNKIDKMHNAKNEAMNGQNKPDDYKNNYGCKTRCACRTRKSN